MKEVLITIGIGDAGQLLVTANFGNLIQCYGLLEAAKDVVRQENQKLQAKAAIVAPTDGERFALINGNGHRG